MFFVPLSSKCSEQVEELYSLDASSMVDMQCESLAASHLPEYYGILDALNAISAHLRQQ